MQWRGEVIPLPERRLQHFAVIESAADRASRPFLIWNKPADLVRQVDASWASEAPRFSAVGEPINLQALGKLIGHDRRAIREALSGSEPTAKSGAIPFVELLITNLKVRKRGECLVLPNNTFVKRTREGHQLVGAPRWEVRSSCMVQQRSVLVVKVLLVLRCGDARRKEVVVIRGE